MITSLKAIKVEINLSNENKDTAVKIDIQSVKVLKETLVQLRIQSLDIGAYRNILSKAEVGKILNLFISESRVIYIIFVPSIENKEKLKMLIDNSVKTTMSTVNAEIKKRISKYKKVSKYLEEGTENFNFIE